MCCSSVTALGILWGLVSTLGAAATTVGLFLPFWIEGELLGGQKTSFGIFTRCGFAQMTESGIFEIQSDCGRYADFKSIPSGWWQLSSVVTGLGATLALLVTATTLISLCVADLINSTSAKVIGGIQFTAGLLVVSGLLSYPLGWGSGEVLEACAESSGPYQLGTCRISWSFYLLAGGALLLFISFGFSARACKGKKGTYRI